MYVAIKKIFRKKTRFFTDFKCFWKFAISLVLTGNRPSAVGPRGSVRVGARAHGVYGTRATGPIHRDPIESTPRRIYDARVFISYFYFKIFLFHDPIRVWRAIIKLYRVVSSYRRAHTYIYTIRDSIVVILFRTR